MRTRNACTRNCSFRQVSVARSCSSALSTSHLRATKKRRNAASTSPETTKSSGRALRETSTGQAFCNRACVGTLTHPTLRLSSANAERSSTVIKSRKRRWGCCMPVHFCLRNKNRRAPFYVTVVPRCGVWEVSCAWVVTPDAFEYRAGFGTAVPFVGTQHAPTVESLTCRTPCSFTHERVGRIAFC